MPRVSKGQLAQRLLETEEQVRALERSTKTLKERRAELRGRLVEVAELQPDHDYVIAGVRIRYRDVDGRLTYDITAAIDEEAISEEQLKPYERTGEPYEVWTVKKAVTPEEAEAAAKELLA